MAQIDNIINVNSVWNSTTSLPILESVTLKVWIYSGIQGNSVLDNNDLAASNARLLDPTYTLRGTAILNGTDKVASFDIAPLIRDYVESELNQTHNGDNAVWVDLQRIATIGGQELILASEHYLALDGYEYTMDIVGNQYDEEVRMSNIQGDPILVSEGSVISIPVLSSLVDSFKYLEQGLLVTSDVLALSDDSSEQILYIESDINKKPDWLEVTLRDGGGLKFPIQQICEERYEHVKLTFVNRLGAFQDVWFFANSKRALQVKSDNWNRRNLVSGGGAYRSTTVKNITNVNETITLNSGFYPESSNVVFEELIQADNVWITKGIETFPILIKNSGFNFQDSNTNKAINYTISFEYAFNKMKSL